MRTVTILTAWLPLMAPFTVFACIGCTEMQIKDYTVKQRSIRCFVQSNQWANWPYYQERLCICKQKKKEKNMFLGKETVHVLIQTSSSIVYVVQWVSIIRTSNQTQVFRNLCKRILWTVTDLAIIKRLPTCNIWFTSNFKTFKQWIIWKRLAIWLAGSSTYIFPCYCQCQQIREYILINKVIV